MITGVKRKDTKEEKIAKSIAKRARNADSSENQTLPKPCKSCKNYGHSSASSKLCPNHKMSLQERIETHFGTEYTRYTISIPLRSFYLPQNMHGFDQAVEKVKSLSMFSRKVMSSAQLFINFYILKHPECLDKAFFQQNFWYSLCRVIYKNLTVDEFQKQYDKIRYLAETWSEIHSIEGVNLVVPKNGVKNFGQIISTACESTATSYNNYYIENFQNITSNYFIYMIRSEFPVSDE